MTPRARGLFALPGKGRGNGTATPGARVIVHQSDLKSWARCPEAYHLDKLGEPNQQLSATAYGSVMHHAMHVGERTGDWEAAEQTFRHYWHPSNIEAICHPVQIWIRKDSYGSLLAKGVETLRRYAALKPFSSEELLALEYEFTVPIHGTVDRQTGEPHLLAGTVDRLAIRRYNRTATVCIDDFKTTPNRPSYLRHNIQGTAYAYASTQPVFWRGSGEYHTEGFGGPHGDYLYDGNKSAPRRFWWIDLHNLKWVDGGFRTSHDYDRLAIAVQRFADSVQADIFPLNIDGEVCQWCHHRKVCAGIGVEE